jgi:TPR repeat protein
MNVDMVDAILATLGALGGIIGTGFAKASYDEKKEAAKKIAKAAMNGKQGGMEENYEEKDEKMAAKWFLKVAEQTNAESVRFSPEMKALIDAYKTINAASTQENKDPNEMLRDRDQKNMKQAELIPAMKLLSDANKKACTDLSQANNGPRISVDVPVLRPDQTYSDELLKKAESGDSTAQRHLGSCYYRGLGIKKDITKAIELWEKSALQGDIKAQSNLGTLYFLDQKNYKIKNHSQRSSSC